MPLAFWFPPIAPACAQVIGANVLWKCALSPFQWLNNRAKKSICVEHEKVNKFLSETLPQEKSIAQANHVQLLEAAFQDTTQDAFIQALQTILDNKTI